MLTTLYFVARQAESIQLKSGFLIEFACFAWLCAYRQTPTKYKLNSLLCKRKRVEDVTVLRFVFLMQFH